MIQTMMGCVLSRGIGKHSSWRLSWQVTVILINFQIIFKRQLGEMMRTQTPRHSLWKKILFKISVVLSPQNKILLKASRSQNIFLKRDKSRTLGLRIKFSLLITYGSYCGVMHGHTGNSRNPMGKIGIQTM